MLNPFERTTGSDRMRSPVNLLVMVSLLVLSALMIAKLGLTIGLGLLILPFVSAYFYLLFLYPVIGIYTAVFFGFTLLGLARYVDLQVGLLMDGILFLTFIALIFNKFYDKTEWKPAKKDITILAIIWFGYSLFELVNPESQSVAAWASSIRGISLYMLLIIVLTLILVDTNKKIDYIIYLWAGLSLLASIKGVAQHLWGVDRFEQAWLDAGAAQTHVLFGKLRIFSFLNDAGQFGANQAYSGVVALILFFEEKDWRKKTFFIIVALLGFYGMLLSGTRGAISIPIVGLGTYFILKKNKMVMLSGFIALVLIFVFFKFTSIGDGNEQIRRMRTAFDPNDPSFQVRLENQRILKAYLVTRPFGGGLGQAGVKAKKYVPNGFLSNIATDSWYVLIWAEQGIVGLLLHLFILFYIVIKSGYLIMNRIRDPILKIKMSALLAGMAGVMVASYGNAVLGTFPTSITIYISMALLLNTEKFDTPLPEGKIKIIEEQEKYLMN
ncbi:MAG: O-antigen ligase family protein [Bacteroidia bacterium]|nr:O-antigen ligase family protein [Bacteroidia bacterium]